MTQLQCSCSSSAMFLSGAAQNFLTIKLAAELGVIIPDVYITWLKGAEESEATERPVVVPWRLICVVSRVG